MSPSAIQTEVRFAQKFYLTLQTASRYQQNYLVPANDSELNEMTFSSLGHLSNQGHFVLAAFTDPWSFVHSDFCNFDVAG